MTTAAGASQSETPRMRPSDQLDAKALLGLLGQMMNIRRFEERCAQAYQQAKIGGFCHLYIGQEATAVGSIAATEAGDPIITAYRDHGHALARGMDPRYCMAEMYGKLTGCAKGKGGSMHMFDKPNDMYGGHAIVGGQCPLGVGLAFAIQYRGEKKVCLCYLGDGALNQGAFHEAMNLAAIWKLPIIFVLENNMYSMGTAIARGTSMAHDLSTKAAAYGMRYAECDGMDVLETYDTFAKEIALTRGSTSEALGQPDAGDGPCMINAVTYRYKGHSMSDPQKYRSKDEVDEYQKGDCINRLVNDLIERNLATQEQVDELDAQAKKSAIDAIKYAEEAPDTPIEELYTDIYANPFGPFVKGEPPQIMKDAADGESRKSEDS